MKKIIVLFLLCVMHTFSGKAQLSTTITQALNYLDSNIVPNLNKQITASKLNTAIKKVIAGLQYIDNFGLYNNTDSLTEGSTNLFYTDARARAAISLTTTGTGYPTYDDSSGVLNIPPDNFITDTVYAVAPLEVIDSSDGKQYLTVDLSGVTGGVDSAHMDSTYLRLISKHDATYKIGHDTTVTIPTSTPSTLTKFSGLRETSSNYKMFKGIGVTALGLQHNSLIDFVGSSTVGYSYGQRKYDGYSSIIYSGGTTSSFVQGTTGTTIAFGSAQVVLNSSGVLINGIAMPSGVPSTGDLIRYAGSSAMEWFTPGYVEQSQLDDSTAALRDAIAASISAIAPPEFDIDMSLGNYTITQPGVYVISNSDDVNTISFPDAATMLGKEIILYDNSGMDLTIPFLDHSPRSLNANMTSLPPNGLIVLRALYANGNNRWYVISKNL